MIGMRRWRRGWTHTLTVAAIALAGLFLPRFHAFAQGAEGFIPDPIASEEFNRRLALVKPDYAQRIALEAAHEAYKERFRTLRDGEIAAMLKRMYELEGGNVGMPKRSDVEEILRIRRSIVTQIQVIDRELFDSMEGSLREDQKAGLARMKRIRERAIYELGMTIGFAGLEEVNLFEIVDSLKLPDDVMARIDPLLIDYETSSVDALRALHDKTLAMILDMLDAMGQMGIEGADFEDQAAMEEYGRRMQEALRKVSDGVRDAGNRVRAVSERAHLLIKESLPAEHTRDYEQAYLRRRYPDVFTDWSSPVRMFESAKANEAFASRRSEIVAVEDSWRASYEPIVQRMVQNADEISRANADRMGMMGAEDTTDWESLWGKRQQLDEERNALNQRASTDLFAIVGEEEAAKLESLRGANADETGSGAHLQMVAAQAGASAVQIAVEGVAGEMMISSSARNFDAMVPAPITDREWDGYADRLGLSDDARLIASEFLSTYRTRCAELEAGPLQALVVEPRNRLWTETGPDEKAHAAYLGGVREATSRLIDLEDQFFDDLALLLDERTRARLPEIRRARECVIYDLGSAVPYGGGTVIDLPNLIRSTALSPEELRVAGPAIASFEEKLLPVLRRQYDAQIARSEAEPKAQAVMRRIQEEPDGDMAAWEEWQAIMEPHDERQQAIAEERREVEQAAAAEIEAALPGAAQQRFRDLVRRQSYPQVFPDPEDATPTLDYARQLPDLSNEQRVGLEVIAAEHAERHAALCDEMVSLLDEGTDYPQWDSGDPEAMADWQQRQARQTVLQYERTEFNETTRRRIRALLAEAQAVRVHGLGVEAPATTE